MFLFGLLAGIVLTSASGVRSTFVRGNPVATNQKVPTAPQAPQAPQVPQAPQANIQDTMLGFASDAGLDETEFKTCVAADKFKQLFADEEAAAQKAGISGTPGNILIDMKSGNARLLSGAQPLAVFQKNVDEMLKNPTAKSTDPNAPSATNVPPVDLEKDHILGSKDARLALIEYSDYQCPFCHRVHPTLQQLLQQNDGKILWVLRHFPLGFHPNAIPLATGAECANEIGGSDAFWSFTDKAMSSDAVN